MLVGKQLVHSDKLVLVDDVVTAGTAIRESIEILKSCDNPKISAVVISVDRMEKGLNEQSAIQELQSSTGISFFPIVTIVEIIEYLKEALKQGQNIITTELLTQMEEYRKIYGV